MSNVPALVVVLALEGRPLVYFDALSEAEERHLLAWLYADAARAALLERVLELVGREAAA